MELDHLNWRMGEAYERQESEQNDKQCKSNSKNQQYDMKTHYDHLDRKEDLLRETQEKRYCLIFEYCDVQSVLYNFFIHIFQEEFTLTHNCQKIFTLYVVLIDKKTVQLRILVGNLFVVPIIQYLSHLCSHQMICLAAHCYSRPMTLN